MYTQCEIAPSKAVVGVDWPVYALSSNKLNTFLFKQARKNVKVLIVAILSIICFKEPKSFMHMFNVSALCRQSIKMFYQKLR